MGSFLDQSAVRSSGQEYLVFRLDVYFTLEIGGSPARIFPHRDRPAKLTKHFPSSSSVPSVSSVRAFSSEPLVGARNLLTRWHA
jgi:hypothetical protein